MHEQGELDSAELLYGEVRAMDPRNFLATHQLGVIQNQKGDHDGAIQTLSVALMLNPRSSYAHLNLGIALANLHRSEEALRHYQMALRLKPGSSEVLVNQAMLLRDLHRLEEALASLESALASEPANPKALLNRALVLQELRHLPEALDAYDQALAVQPADAAAWTCRGVTLRDLNRPQAALESHDQALALQPGHADALLNRSVALMDLLRPEEALACIDQLLNQQPTAADALMNRGNALVQLRRFSEALACFDQSLQLLPGHTDALMNRGLTLHMMGRHEAAMVDFARVLDVQPNLTKARSAKIFMLDYLPDLTFERHQAERKAYGQALKSRLGEQPTRHLNDRRSNRPLVLGYVSADFKHHSAAASFWPVLKHHDKAGFRTVCYSGVVVEDDLSRQFKGVADAWVRAAELTDDELATRILNDRVDILIDLSGHSMGNRLPVFARKPAPIQVTAWGHSGGTGLSSVDYQFTDPVHIPFPVRQLFTETAWDLPSCITYEAPGYAPPVGPLPALSKGHLTFGSLNRYSKITPMVLATWSRILSSVPHSRILIKDGAFDDSNLRQSVMAFFRAQGITPDRVDVRGYSTHEAHLAAYGDVDIALDTFPQNGGITTWESLWMGVPVVALAGGHPSCRISASILAALGLEAWVGGNADEYEAIARRGSMDLTALAHLRKDLRDRITATQAGSPERYTRVVEAAYRSMWLQWLST